MTIKNHEKNSPTTRACAIKFLIDVDKTEKWTTNDAQIFSELMSTLNQYKISGIPQDKDIRQLIDKLIVVLSMIPASKFFKAIAFIEGEIKNAPMKKLIILRTSTILSEENEIKINAQIVNDRLEAIIKTAIFSELISKKAEKLLSE